MNENMGTASALNLRAPFGAPSRWRQPSELESARAEIEHIREEAAAAYEAAAEARARLQKFARHVKFRLRATAVIMLTAALLKLGWETAHAPNPSPTTRVSRSLTPVGVTSESWPKPTATTATSVDNSAGANALKRLRDAFQAFPEEDQIDIVHEMNEKYAGPGRACPLVWKNGAPSLYVGDPTGFNSPSMVNTINRCASELEKLRVDRDAARN
jgi:hypothetical protein